MNQEAKKNKWTPCENDLMHFVYSGVNFYNTYPSKADTPMETKKNNIIESLQTLITNNSHLDDINMEMCLELIEGPLIDQAIDYALVNSKQKTNSYLGQPTKKTPNKNIFCCFGKYKNTTQ